MKVTWQWFRCEVNKKCIHSQSRCDLHPHPACVYNNTETGKMVAEDEEGCLNPDYKYSYKAKGLIEPSANLKCDSPVHHNGTRAIHSTVFNWTTYLFKKNEEVMMKGVPVQIQAVKCNGVPECRKGVDEAGCGFSTFETMIFGNLYFFFLYLNLKSNIFYDFVYAFITYTIAIIIRVGKIGRLRNWL